MKAFEIDPKLKPDMSRFLIHMTGKDAIKSILKGGRRRGEGLIRSLVPKGAKSESFPFKIACFTETPIFALGAFIAISKRREEETMKYGIGFRKSHMVNQNVRPTLYIDNSLLSQLLGVDKSKTSEEVTELVDSIRALSHPLGETMSRQGFTWEREWRFVDQTGFYFDHKDIEVICCPKEEQVQLKLILDVGTEKIRFVDSWTQYKDYTQHIEQTDYKDLVEQSLKNPDPFGMEDSNENLEEHIETLKQYRDYLLSLQANADEVERELNDALEWRRHVEANTASHCGHYSEGIVHHSDFDGTICPDCLTEYKEGYERFMSKD